MTNQRTNSHSWAQIEITVNRPAVEIVCMYLFDAGATGIEQIDETHLPPPEGLIADHVQIKAFFKPGSQVQLLPDKLTKFLQNSRTNLADLTFSQPRIEMLNEEDWADGWRKFFVPTRVGRFFIHPGWENPPPDGSLAVRIDPGQAFGTGLHPTTRLCLREMDGLLPVQSLLDVGCGSGILAIAAARSGVSRVLAVDNDPQACLVTQQNLQLNDVGRQVSLVCAEPGSVTGTFEMIVANILSSVLVPLAPDLGRLLQKNGTLLLSGLLHEEERSVADSFIKVGFTQISSEREEEWSLLRLTRTSQGKAK
ncbi:MAG: 50S ribosomal protein L11 methyltransferase [Deltaproteobacteria bacterium]|nr:50S ribosomal protein L11 methyltransferase [Deltaproteobacteria bacterium]